MTRAELIAMAREADLIDFRDADDDPHTEEVVEFLERFAALVAAREREACTQVCLHYAKALDYGGNEYMRSHECQLAANAIRARGTP